MMTKLLFPFTLALALAGGCASTTAASVGGVKVVGDKIELDDHVNFATGEATILETSHGLLDRIALVLSAEANIASVEIQGHTDATGTPEANQALSEARAKAVADYLVAKGVKQALNPKGYGQTTLLCNEDTADCHAKNRRVEFVISR